MTTLVNLTPHQIIIRPDNAPEIVVPPTAPATRCAVTSVSAGTVNGIPLVRQEFGQVENLPAPIPDVVYIVSTLVAQRAQRADVASPDTGPTAIRENGQVVAVRNLQVFA